jgi:hypothetical protein
MTQGVNYSLPLKFNTIADHFNQTGEYACHMVGKHHLGKGPSLLSPLNTHPLVAQQALPHKP